MPDEKKVDTTLSSDSKLWAALCYFGNLIFPIGTLIALFILLTDKKNDKFALFHAYQSLLLTVILFVLSFVLGVFIVIVSIVTSGLGSFLSCLFLPVGLIAFVLILFVGYKAFMGEKYLIPVVGPMADGYAK